MEAHVYKRFDNKVRINLSVCSRNLFIGLELDDKELNLFMQFLDAVIYEREKQYTIRTDDYDLFITYDSRQFDFIVNIHNTFDTSFSLKKAFAFNTFAKLRDDLDNLLDPTPVLDTLADMVEDD
jgi:hypothetical protein